jgi:hypothetical protein
MLSVQNIRPPHSYSTHRLPYTVTVNTERPPHTYCTHRPPYTHSYCTHRAPYTHSYCTHRSPPTHSYCTHRSPYTHSYCTHRSPYTVTVHTDRPTQSYCTYRYILVPAACIWYDIMSVISISMSVTVFFNSLITDRFKMSNRSLYKLLGPLLTYSIDQSFLRS